jgi:YbbR domain-containing protein
VAFAIAFFLWGMANSSTSTERAFDIPIELHNLPDTIVVTDQNVDSINVRIVGNRVTMRNISLSRLSYPIDVSGGKPGVADYDVDVSRIELPGGAQPVSRSPNRVQIRFEERGRKVVSVRADLTGELPAGFRLVDVNVVPGRVWLSGARSHVLRLDEVRTDPIDLGGLEDSVEREASIHLGGGTVWLEEDQPVKVLLQIARELTPDEVEAENAADPEVEAGDGSG